MLRRICVIIFICLTLKNVSDAARILCVFPYPSHSHQVVFNALNMELHKRGHEMVVFTPNPFNNPNFKNYTEINMSGLYGTLQRKVDFMEKKREGLWSFLEDVYYNSQSLSDRILGHPEMQRILAPDSNEKFDVILVQFVYMDALYIVGHRLQAPMIGVSSLCLLAPHYYILGNPPMTAVVPDALGFVRPNMNIFQRIQNLYIYLRQVYEYLYKNMPLQEEILKKYFGDDTPPIRELSKNITVAFVNNHPILSHSRPMIPIVQYIGGLRLNKTDKKIGKKLPDDLQKIFDQSVQGIIYFSLGSNVKSSELPEETIAKFLRIFRNLPYTVVWKFETDKLSDVPKNVIIRKWFSQRDVLAHPNVKLYIYQGGLQSTEEAIDNTVPIIGMPVYGDQFGNVHSVKDHGGGEVFDLIDFDEQEMKNAIVDIITKPKYKEAMKKLRELIYDVPNPPMETAIWWVEHVIRHKGADHLRSRTRDVSWWKLELLDIISIFLIAQILISYGCFAITKRILRFIRTEITNDKPKETKKTK